MTWQIKHYHACTSLELLKANSHIACCAKKGLHCLYHLIYTVELYLIHICHAMLQPCRSESNFWRPGHSTVWHAWINIGCWETACGWPARVQLLPATTRSSRRLSSESHQSQMQVASVLNCWTSSSDISGYHADFHESHSTVRAEQRRRMGTAMCELAFIHITVSAKT